MVSRWTAAALLETEKNLRKIMGYRDLWMLRAALDPNTLSAQQEVAYNDPSRRPPPTMPGTLSTASKWRTLSRKGYRSSNGANS